MKRSFFLSFFALIITVCVAQNNKIPSFSWVGTQVEHNLSWASEVGAKTYPGSNVYPVKDYQAINDGKTKCTVQIQKAIDACSKAGGGMVTFEPGSYVTGALFLKKGVNLEIGKGVTLLASTDIKDYPEFKSRIAGIEMEWPAAVINVLNQKNVAISGEGTLDCRGKIFWDKYWKMRSEYEKKGLRWIVDYDCKRVRGILISNSSDVSLRNIHLMRTGFWGLQVLYSNHCTIDGMNINNNEGGHGPSTDGIDIDSSTYILVENCDIDCNDDNICIKSGRDADGLRVNRPTEYVVIRNCITRKGAGLITCGSETSGSIRNILAYNMKAYGTASALRIKSAMNRGGTVENIYMDNVEADSVGSVLAADLNWNPSYSYSVLPKKYAGKEIPKHWKVILAPVVPPEKGYPHFKNIYLSNVKAEHVEQFISASGWNKELRLEHFYLYNIQAKASEAGKVTLTDHFSLRKIRLDITNKTKIEFKENTNLETDIQYE